MSQKIYSEDYITQYRWQVGGTITLEADAADYAVTARDDASVEALVDTKKVIIKPSNGSVTIAFRFRSDGSENDDSILQLFAASGADHYIHESQLTITQGTQIHSTGIYFCDTITAADEKWIYTPGNTTKGTPTTSNGIAMYLLNTYGFDRFWFVANDLDTTTVYIDWRRV